MNKALLTTRRNTKEIWNSNYTKYLQVERKKEDKGERERGRSFYMTKLIMKDRGHRFLNKCRPKSTYTFLAKTIIFCLLKTKQAYFEKGYILPLLSLCYCLVLCLMHISSNFKNHIIHNLSFGLVFALI